MHCQSCRCLVMQTEADEANEIFPAAETLCPACAARMAADHLDETVELAAEFAALLAETIGIDGLATVNARNAAETDPSICHSHDLCDPNQVMLDAFEAVTGAEPLLTPERGDRDEAEHARQLEGMQDAWTLARSHNFDADAIRRLID